MILSDFMIFSCSGLRLCDGLHTPVLTLDTKVPTFLPIRISKTETCSIQCIVYLHDVQSRLTFEEVAGGTDTLGQQILKTQDQGLQDVYDLNQSSSPFPPRLRMRYQLTLQELNTSF